MQPSKRKRILNNERRGESVSYSLMIFLLLIDRNWNSTLLATNGILK